MGAKSTTMEHAARMGNLSDIPCRTTKTPEKTHRTGPSVEETTKNITLHQIMNAWKQAAKYTREHKQEIIYGKKTTPKNSLPKKAPKTTDKHKRI